MFVVFVFCSERDRDHRVSLVLGRRVGAPAYNVYVGNLCVIAKTQQEADIVSPFVVVSVKGFGLCGEPWTRFFGVGRSPDVPWKWLLVASPSFFSVPELHYVLCTRAIDSRAQRFGVF